MLSQKACVEFAKSVCVIFTKTYCFLQRFMIEFWKVRCNVDRLRLHTRSVFSTSGRIPKLQAGGSVVTRGKFVEQCFPSVSARVRSRIRTILILYNKGDSRYTRKSGLYEQQNAVLKVTFRL